MSYVQVTYEKKLSQTSIEIFALWVILQTVLCQKTHVRAKSLQLCPALCNPVDCSLPGFSARGIIQARKLEWVAMPSSRGFPDPEIEPASVTSPALADGFCTTGATWEAPVRRHVTVILKKEIRTPRL